MDLILLVLDIELPNELALFEINMYPNFHKEFEVTYI